MAAGRANLAALRVEGLLVELLGREAYWSIYVRDYYTLVLRVRITWDGPVLEFEELIEEFPSEKLKAQLMLIAPVKK